MTVDDRPLTVFTVRRLRSRYIYASLSHIDDAKWMSKLTVQFPDEDIKVLDEIAHWVIQYEYLR